MSDASGLWSLLTILGPILLAVVLIWAMLHNRRSKRANDRTEVATSANYDEQDRVDHEAGR